MEDDWEQATPLISSKGSKWLLGGLGALSVFFVICSIWAAVLLSNAGDTEESGLASARPEVRKDAFERRQEAVQKYLTATTVEQKAAYVRSRERVEPLMRNHYSKFPLEAAAEVNVSGEAPVVVEDQTMWQVYVEVDAKKEGLLVEMMDDGSVKVDWELEVVYQPTDLDQFRNQRSTQPSVFRVLIQGAQLEGFHGYSFSNYNKFRCYKVTIPKRDEYLWAYTEIGSDLDKQWFNFITSGTGEGFDRAEPKAVMLELYYPENSQSARCVHLGMLLKSGWMH